MIYINNYTHLPYNKVYLGDRLIYGNDNNDDSNNDASDEEGWVTLTSDTSRDIPMKTFRIDATDPNASGYYFITFSVKPNYDGENAIITQFSICPDEGNIWDYGRLYNIIDQTHIEGNIYEYTFSQVVYFASAEQNAPLSQVKYKPMSV